MTNTPDMVTRRKALQFSSVVISGFAGCLGVGKEAEESKTTPTATPTVTPTETNTPAEQSEPDMTVQYGESVVDTDLKISVEAPTIETSFEYDGKTYEMPKGDALAVASVEFSNTHSAEVRPIDGPIFTLVTDETTILETHSVNHPEFDPSIRTRQMDDFSTTGRWNSHGSTVEPNENRDGTAVFEVGDTTEPSTLKIVYESDRIKDDRFGDKVVEWSQ